MNQGEPFSAVGVAPLLWWVSASRDSTREYVVKTLVEAYFFRRSFPAPGDLANARLCRAMVQCLRARKVRWGQGVLPCGLDLAACRNLSVHEGDMGLYFYLVSRNCA